MLDPNNLRRNGIGGSEVGAIFGCHPYLDEFALWARKKGDLPAAEPSSRMMAGKFFEEAILKFYAYQTKREVEYCDRTMNDPARPWMVYTPDGLVRGERRGVDAKLVSWDQRRNWGHTADEVPQYIQFQAFYYMAAMDYPVWDIAAMVGDELRIIPVERLDADAERVLLLRVSEWHQRFVLGDDRPGLDGSPTAAAWLQAKFPYHKRPDLRFATAEEIAMLTEYARVRMAQREVEERKEVLENLIKAAIGEREGLVWPDGKFTWRRTKDSSIVDWESFTRGLLNEFVPDPAKREDLETFYTRPKPGYRRIRFEHDDLRGEDAA